MSVGGETISETDMDVWKAAVIGRISHGFPKCPEIFGKTFRYFSIFCLFGMLNTLVMLLIGKASFVWYLCAFGIFFGGWVVIALSIRIYWCKRHREEQIQTVLQISIDDVYADTAGEIESYERLYDLYITPKRRARTTSVR